MKLSKLSTEEIELMSHTDIAYHLIKENKKSMNTPTVFRKISDLLGYTEDEYVAKIGDFYTSLTIDKRFLLLENNEWDIRDRHSVEVVVDDEDEDVILDENEEEENIIDEIEEDIDSIDEDEALDNDNDLEDLSIIDDEEEEEE